MTHNTRDDVKMEILTKKVHEWLRNDGDSVSFDSLACANYVHHQLQKVREEEREQCIKAISNSRTLGEKLGVSVECEGARWQAIWDIQKINHSELDQPKSTGENGYSPNAKDIKGAGGLNGLVQDKV